MAVQPTYVVFAGVNGAGKSTFYRSRYWCDCEADMHLPRVNPDEILALEGKDWSSAANQLWAGKQAVREIDEHFRRMESFNQETTLTGRTSVMRIQKAFELGYRVKLFYIGVDSCDIALERIRHRVGTGGHDIDEEDVTRRFSASLSALGKVLDYTHEVSVFDNSNGFERLAAWENGSLFWCSPRRFRQHEWLFNAIKQEGWR